MLFTSWPLRTSPSNRALQANALGPPPSLTSWVHVNIMPPMTHDASEVYLRAMRTWPIPRDVR